MPLLTISEVYVGSDKSSTACNAKKIIINIIDSVDFFNILKTCFTLSHSFYVFAYSLYDFKK